MKLTINRKRWLRGDGSSMLLRSADKKMCCLGFYCRAVGFKPREIRDLGTPRWLVKKWDARLKGLVSKRVANTAVCTELMRENDAIEVEEPFREKRIAALFKRIGVEVRFVG